MQDTTTLVEANFNVSNFLRQRLTGIIGVAFI